jgi:hypothetical protein
VHRYHANGVVDTQALKQSEPGGGDDASNEADDRRTAKRRNVGGSGNRDQPADDAVQDARHFGPPRDQPSGQETRQTPEHPGQYRIGDDVWQPIVNPQVAATVETEPAQPEDEHAKRGQGQVVTLDRPTAGAEAPDSGPDSDDRGERHPAAD